MNKEDLKLKEELKLKNKEIYFNKLNLDIDNNIEVLILTINNLLDDTKDSLIKKIIEIEESTLDKDLIEESITLFFKEYQTILLDLLNEKKEYLKFDLENINKLNSLFYCNFVKDTLGNMELDNLINSLTSDLNDNFIIKRLIEYLNNIFILNLNSKILSIIKNRDIILINTIRETYNKYLELNKKTIGI